MPKAATHLKRATQGTKAKMSSKIQCALVQYMSNDKYGAKQTKDLNLARLHYQKFRREKEQNTAQ
jgi:hypothetical protein